MRFVSKKYIEHKEEKHKMNENDINKKHKYYVV